MNHIASILEYFKESEDGMIKLIDRIKEITYILNDIDVSTEISNMTKYGVPIVRIVFTDLKSNPNRTDIAPYGGGFLKDAFKKSDEMLEFVDRLHSICSDVGYKILNHYLISDNSIKICAKSQFNEIYKNSWERLINNIHRYDSLIENGGLKFNVWSIEDPRKNHRGEIRYAFYGGNILKKMSYSKGIVEFEKKVQPICNKLGFVLVIPRSEGSNPDDDLISSSYFSIYRKEFWNEIINNRDSRNSFLINYGKCADRLPGYIERWGPYQKGQDEIAKKEFYERRGMFYKPM